MKILYFECESLQWRECEKSRVQHTMHLFSRFLKRDSEVKERKQANGYAFCLQDKAKNVE